ncbi:hypothetical protein F4821DRAFT_262418 [Hypoxylon rubiginosum]|uniref:Uncharacterized protein n=1 Tax=Hypoxylon rubiginosum TaxID=110542 RepID=A0ACC0CUK3_9PEZI|nr:hypothetical protein F4821DRAFT_262418 [Hypoxylon rubiginosum]
MASDDFIRYAAEELLLIREHAGPLYEYVPTVLLSHELWNSKPCDWDELLTQKVVGCWLAARERQMNHFYDGYTEENNDWVVILETQEGLNITIELRQVDPTGNTITVCRPATPLHVVNTSSNGSISVQLDGYAYSFMHHVRCYISVEAWIDRLEKSGITRYQLVHDRGQFPLYPYDYGLYAKKYLGRRYWVHCALRQFQSFLTDDIPSLGSESVMLRTWELGRELAKWENIPDETEFIMAGRFLPMKLPHNSPLSKFNTITGRGRGRGVQFPTYWHEDHNKPRSENGSSMPREPKVMLP